ncbi:hypothetical protein JX265_005015 [Neoarthrinium moseri]|uniref:ER-bound oxygenase mpaB/mpaB'/Rubber oxygenase catalytic domain-containing protein n=1 Tax=Neoarthrinium moseri TaxID=1658444 RepID=A0A9P9WPJ7_9PEZI|nr:hypothetical protein JX265_005015 [Neoarthrinium moseri]
MGLFSREPNDMKVYGYKFRWGSLHQSPEELHPLIYTYDTVASDAVEALDELVPPAPTGPRKDIQEAVEPQDTKRHRDLYALVQKHAKVDERVGKLWDEINAVPEWVDWEQIDRGQKVFWRYGGPAITALTFLSLLGGMGGGRTVETLDRTGGFGAQVVRRRLLETTQHTLGVHKDLAAIQPGGEGFESSVRVRLLHASVRRRVTQLAKAKPEYYDLKKYGVPVNDLDCIGTIGTFSSTVVWMGFPRQGIWLRQQEIEDYLALWRYVAYLMGTPHDWLATPETAKAMMESLLVSEIKPTKKSGTLANNIITGFEGQPPTYASRGFLNAETWWLNGSELAQELGIEKPNIYYRALAFGQCIYFMISGYIARSIPFLDEANIKLTRKVLYQILVHNKSKGALGYITKYNFKWIPDLKNTTTPLGDPVPGQAQKSGAFYHSGVERTALITLVVVGTVVGLTGWASLRLANNLGWLASPRWGWDSAAAPFIGLLRDMKA